MPAFNAEKYIAESVKSILNQTYSNLELIVVDDGSTDDTLKILESINDHRLIICKNMDNKGIVYTLNEAVKISKGYYLARMDADDISSLDRFEKQIDFLERNCYDIVSSVVYKFNDNFRRIFPFEMSSDDVCYALYYFNPIVHPCVFGYTHIFKRFPYKEEYRLAEDYKLWCDLAVANFKIGVQPDILLEYRLHNGQSSVKNKIIQTSLNLKIQNDYHDFYYSKKFNISAKVRLFSYLKRLQSFLGLV
jgi:glycosyltransferase involved in cell wall biosynthesis